MSSINSDGNRSNPVSSITSSSGLKEKPLTHVNPEPAKTFNGAALTAVKTVANKVSQSCIGYRPLEGMGVVVGKPSSQADKDNNMVAHQHIWVSKTENIGFGPQGLFEESPSNKNEYIYMDCSYDAKIIKKAINYVGNPGEYSFWLDDNNCQDYVDRVIQEYKKIKGKND